MASVGAAGFFTAFAEIFRTIGRAAAAIVIAASIYWAATIPLWFYNDRYYLVLVPAGAIVLALAPLPRIRLVHGGGICDDARDGTDVARRDVRVSARDGGDSSRRATNSSARELRDPRSTPATRSTARIFIAIPSMESKRWQLEAGIPMITSPQMAEYTIASEVDRRHEVVRRLKWPGPFGLGHRYFYLVKKRPAPADANPQNAAPRESEEQLAGAAGCGSGHHVGRHAGLLLDGLFKLLHVDLIGQSLSFGFLLRIRPQAGVLAVDIIVHLDV